MERGFLSRPRGEENLFAANRPLLSKCARQFAGNNRPPRNASLTEKCDGFVSLSEDRPGRGGFLSLPVRGIPGARRHRRVSRTISFTRSKVEPQNFMSPCNPFGARETYAGEEQHIKKMTLLGILDVKIASLTFLESFYFTLTFPATAFVTVSCLVKFIVHYVYSLI